jgi:hypothetical protein
MKRVAGKLSYANVMATVAVFLALGGGITMAAISGNGSVRFGGTKGLPFFERETVLNLPGIGKVQADCEQVTEIRFRNKSGGTLQASFRRESDSDFGAAVLVDGESLATSAQLTGGDDAIDTIRFHVFKADGKPAAEITVSHRYAPGSCEARVVTAQAVASE